MQLAYLGEACITDEIQEARLWC